MTEHAEDLVSGEIFDTNKYYEDRILHTLMIYPKISPTMLQVALGTSTSSKLWRPILDKLTQEGLVVQEYVSATSPAGRQQSYMTISLAPKATVSSSTVTEPEAPAVTA